MPAPRAPHDHSHLCPSHFLPVSLRSAVDCEVLSGYVITHSPIESIYREGGGSGVFRSSSTIGGTFTDCVLAGHPATDVTATAGNSEGGCRPRSIRRRRAAGLNRARLRHCLALPEVLARTERSGMARRSARTPSLESPGPCRLIRPLGHGDALAIMRGTGGSRRSVEDVCLVQGTSAARPLIVPGAS